VLTIFQHSRALVQNCTFTNNRNAVDDMGGMSLYRDCIFADDLLTLGTPGTSRYELDLPAGGTVEGCAIRGAIRDPLVRISPKDNLLNTFAPAFDKRFVPHAPELVQKGYHPVQ
jgi:hypothetical protein